MITWVQELTMMHQGIRLPQWHTVLMELGLCTFFIAFLFSASDERLLFLILFSFD
jgi:hypothetical protein